MNERLDKSMIIKAELKKERVYLCAPNSCVATSVNIIGNIEIDKLRIAIKEAVKHNEILNTKIQVEANGNAYYITDNVRPIPPISISNFSWQEIAEEQVKIRFNIESGELIRFFIIHKPDGIQLLIINHHLAGDGLSIAFLIEDIMNILSGKEIAHKEIQLMDPEHYNGVSPLSPMIRFLMKRLNKSWGKSGTIFQPDDHIRLFNKYWSQCNVKIYSQAIDKNTLEKLYQLSKQNNVSMNSILLTAFYKVFQTKTDIGISINLRNKENKDMGNYATGVSIQYDYDKGLSFCENAVIVHKAVYEKINNNKEKFFLMQFMNGLSKTLIDATYFSIFDNYKNRAAKMIANMFGYSNDPQGISITNLTKIPIATNYGPYQLSNYLCVPPLVPNIKMIFGISTFDELMNITMCVEENSLLDKKELLESIIEVLIKKPTVQ